jgi:hypothetical protein
MLNVKARLFVFEPERSNGVSVSVAQAQILVIIAALATLYAFSNFAEDVGNLLRAKIRFIVTESGVFTFDLEAKGFHCGVLLGVD